MLKIILHFGVRQKTVREYWEGTNILKVKKLMIFNSTYNLWVIEGKSIHYHINGNINKEYNYINDKLDGVQKIYNDQGQIIEIHIYDNGLLIAKEMINSL